MEKKMEIKITLRKSEYDSILKMIQPEIDECETMNNYGGDHGENLREIKQKIFYSIKLKEQEVAQ
tara:strand:- start:3514 stop:3708 length:195 start_codon:yes stop_codon:yes gene_type:complete